MTAPRHALEPALATLGRGHRKVVARSIGADADTAAAIGTRLRDEAVLDELVRGLPSKPRGLVTRVAFAQSNAWSSHDALPADAVDVLERHGLVVRFETRWGATVCAPADLEQPLRRIRLRAHAARVPEANVTPARVVAAPDQVLHDVAAVGSAIAAEPVPLKVDGGLYARAYPRLEQALPQLDLGLQGLERIRVEMALVILQDAGALRVRGSDFGQGSRKRDLLLDADLVALLDAPERHRSGLLAALDRDAPGQDLVDGLLDELAGRTVTLGELAAAIEQLFAEAGKRLPDDAIGVTLAIAIQRWLRGDASLALDASGLPIAIELVPADAPAAIGPPCLAQGDFELIAMRALLPHERAALLLVAEAVAGREHVARITKQRVQRAHGAGIDVVSQLHAIAGALPQNVERTVTDWVAAVAPIARLCSAVLVELPGAADGDRLAAALGAHAVRRLGPTLIAVAAEEIKAVAKAIKLSGLDLESGIDHISGPWPRGLGHGEDDLSSWWRPSQRQRRPQVPPEGSLTSGLGPSGATRSRPPARPDRDDEVTLELDLELEPGPAEVLLESCYTGQAVRMRYAGAQGLRDELVTVEDLDGARVQVRDVRTGDVSWRWLRAVAEAELMPEL